MYEIKKGIDNPTFLLIQQPNSIYGIWPGSFYNYKKHSSETGECMIDTKLFIYIFFFVVFPMTLHGFFVMWPTVAELRDYASILNKILLRNFKFQHYYFQINRNIKMQPCKSIDDVTCFRKYCTITSKFLTFFWLYTSLVTLHSVKCF